MSNSKLLFFDIDGTLLTPYPWKIPESARTALKEAQKNGHKLFINSGRTYAMIPDKIKELNFDGYVCGCGSQIYMDGKLLLSSSNPHELCVETIDILRKCKIPAFFECPDRILYDGSSAILPDAIQNLRTEVKVEDLSLYKEPLSKTFTFDKFLVFPRKDADMETFREFADRHFTRFVHADDAWELTQKAYSKATGIQFLMEYLEKSLEDTYAFGDSTNDLPMLKYAGTSIAMGLSDPAILPFCTWQTTDIEDNGIKNALEHFGLI